MGVSNFALLQDLNSCMGNYRLELLSGINCTRFMPLIETGYGLNFCHLAIVYLHISCLHVHSATASVQELRPSALRSELAFRALRVLDSSPLAGSGSLSKNFCPWQRGYAATWEQRTFAPFGMCPD